MRPIHVLLSVSLLAAVLAFTVGHANPAEGTAIGSWTEDQAAAQAKATETDRPILVLFTGSDWCPPCKSLESEVFGDQAFYDWADQNVVLLKADFPRRKAQAETLKEANRALRDRAPGFEGYPSLYLWDVKTDNLRQVSVGYAGDGTRAVIQRISRGLR